MFKEAVQGLIKICFPAGVLDELSLDIIESHARARCNGQQNSENARIGATRDGS